jgi:hypothetical protein
MRRFVFVGLLGIFSLAACGDGDAGAQTAAPAGEDPQSCKGCHRKLNPGLLADLERSPHERVRVRCEECHLGDHDRIFADKGEVPPTVCGGCHEKEWKEFGQSRHGRHLRDGKPNPNLRAHWYTVGSCSLTTGCHSIQKAYPDGSVGRCGGCHPTHLFSNHEARNPRVCYACHCGADNPEYDAWLTSAHSFRASSGKGFVADCVECHDTHDVSRGITRGLSPATGNEPPTFEPVSPAEDFEARREVMLARCRKCHGTRFAREALNLADRWRRRGAALVTEAGRIVAALERDGLLAPGPADRVPNPIVGSKLRLGGEQIYDFTMSPPERIYYDMRYHLYPRLWRSAFHTDPERAVWELNDALKTKLDDLRELDRVLRAPEVR